MVGWNPPQRQDNHNDSLRSWWVTAVALVHFDRGAATVAAMGGGTSGAPQGDLRGTMEAQQIVLSTSGNWNI